MCMALKSAVLSVACCCAAFGTTQARADCASDFQSMMSAHVSAGPYHVSSVGGAKTYDLEIKGPSEFHLKEYESGDLNTPSGEVVVTSDGGWARQGSAKWDAIPDDAVKMIVSGFDDGLPGGFKTAVIASCKGYEPAKALPDGRKATAYFDFKADIFDLHRGKVAADIGLFKSEDGLPAALLVRTGKGDETQLITYDPGIKVTAPEH